jgi:hypothetical protein
MYERNRAAAACAPTGGHYAVARPPKGRLTSQRALGSANSR